MEVMIKFEVEILNFYSYGQLMATREGLLKLKKILLSGEKDAKNSSNIGFLIYFEAQKNRIDENIKAINIVMYNKESDCFDSFNNEPICLN